MVDYPQIQALVRRQNENFPVASYLLPKTARSAILHFYSFARNADDIADSVTLSAQEKVTLLHALECNLRAQDAESAPRWAEPYIGDLRLGRNKPQHGLDLLRAFLQDAEKSRYVTFGSLLNYCRFSAVPVGRAVLECCGETQASIPASDALCTVLQLINHLQDCGKDYRQLNRIYLPQEWMRNYEVEEEQLAASRSSPALRALFDRYIAECRALLAAASPLPQTVRSLRLRLELALILELAEALLGELSHHDPLQKTVKIAHWKWPAHLFRSLFRL